MIIWSDEGEAPLSIRSVLLVVLIAASAALAGTPLPDRLSREESADFALAGARAQLEPSYRKRALGLDFEGERPNSHFYTWSVIPTWGQGVSFYSVDRRTGDVWPALGCELIHSRELAALQARFRQRFNISKRLVRRIESEGDPNVGCS